MPAPSSPGYLGAERDIEAVLERATERTRHDYPRTRAILLKGSHVRGDAGPYSDIDLDVLVAGSEDSRYLAWFGEERGRLRHISVAVRPWDEWWEEAAEPVDWAMGFAAYEVFRLIWAAVDEDAARLRGTGVRHPAAQPELEDFFSDLGKVRNAWVAGDELGVRLAAHAAARLSPSVLAAANPGYPAAPVVSARAAIDAALAFPVAPQGYREDLLLCLGLSDGHSAMTDVAVAAERLVMGTISLLRDHRAWSPDPDDPRFEIGLDEALADGTLSRYLGQLEPASNAPLRAREMTRRDWQWVEQWFRDAELDQRLGPLDEEWLEHVLSDREGVQLVVESVSGTPVALAGCAWDPVGSSHGITDLAVCPWMRRFGIGQRALKSVLEWSGHPPTKRWVAFVDPDNHAAQAFFSAIGWHPDGIEDGMHRFSFEPQTSA
ncbi:MULTISPECIES: GNAT family N-acetyltransferase [unclassified Mycolicibacterium]|uniref:GNAT family N-acetyltransferase n=1 Tax=unclassified Mycolicibacterium TaxID=2636767 RepID=UPI002ED944AE